MFLIMANNLEIKMSTFKNYNLSLPSFMAVSFPYVVDVLSIYFIYIYIYMYDIYIYIYIYI